MATVNNPFIVYGYKGSEYFCDREKETARMLKTLHSERNITLVAPRRMGKTGLICHLFDTIAKEEPDTRCFYIDILPTKNLEQLVMLLSKAILGKLDTFSQTAFRRIQDFFGSWRPTVSFDQLTGLPSVSLDVRPSEGQASLRQVFEYLRQSGKRCYVAIDEFQQILQYAEDGVEALIRSYIQFLPNVYFIFSGSHQHMMEEIFLSSNRPFFQSSVVMSLDCIDKQQYLAFANKFFAVQNRSIDEEVLQHIYDLSDGITWYIQSVLHGIYDHAEQEISLSLVTDVVDEILGEQTAAYQNYCAWLTENQLALLTAIAKEKIVAAPMSQRFTQAHNLPSVSSIKSALNALNDKQLVGHTPQGYVVNDRFFALWLAK